MRSSCEAMVGCARADPAAASTATAAWGGLRILGSGNFIGAFLRIPYHVSRVLISIGQYLVAVVRSSAHQCHHRYSDTLHLYYSDKRCGKPPEIRNRLKTGHSKSTGGPAVSKLIAA